MTSRRDFNRRLAATAIALTLPSMTRARQSKPASRFIDVHTHLGQTWNTTQPLTAEGLPRWMDANDVAQAIVLPLVSPESSSYRLTSDFVLAETAPQRDRLVPFCLIGHGLGWWTSISRAVTQADLAGGDDFRGNCSYN